LAPKMFLHRSVHRREKLGTRSFGEEGIDLRTLLISSEIKKKEKERTEKGIAMEVSGCPFCFLLFFPYGDARVSRMVVARRLQCLRHVLETMCRRTVHCSIRVTRGDARGSPMIPRRNRARGPINARELPSPLPFPLSVPRLASQDGGARGAVVTSSNGNSLMRFVGRHWRIMARSDPPPANFTRTLVDRSPPRLPRH